MMTPVTERKPYPMGIELIQHGACPIEATNPMACWFCPYGHATECHHPHDCETAQCSHCQSEEGL
jgi:hypothetical protein